MTPRQSRILAVLLLLAAVGLVYSVAVEPVRSVYNANQDTLETLENQLARYRQLASRRAALEQQVRDLSSTQPTDKYYLRNKTEALAAAELQAHIGKIVASANGTIISTQPLATVSKELLPKVRVRVRMSGEIAAVRKIFYELESGTPFLFIEEVSISSHGRPVRRKTTYAQNRPLDVQFELSGYIRSTAL